jgi:hypothetical protein
VVAGVETAKAGALMMIVPNGSLPAGGRVCTEVVEPVYVVVSVTKGPVKVLCSSVEPGVEMAKAGALMTIVPDRSLPAGGKVCTEVVKPVYVVVTVTNGPVKELCPGVAPGDEMAKAGALMMIVPDGSLPAGGKVCTEVVEPVYVVVSVINGPV